MFQGFPGWNTRIDPEQALLFSAAVGEGNDADGFDRGVIAHLLLFADGESWVDG